MAKRDTEEVKKVGQVQAPKNASRANLRVGSKRSTRRASYAERSASSDKQVKIAMSCGGGGVSMGGGGSGGGLFGGGFGGGGGGNTINGAGGNYYSPELSTDFLELPQSLDEKRNYFRFFYESHPFIGQAIDLHTELPLSKIRLRLPPDAKDPELARQALEFCETWAKKIGLLRCLISATHDYWKLGEAFIFAEDNSPDLPDDVRNITTRVVNTETGEVTVNVEERPDADERHNNWNAKNYHGWSNIRVLPPEQVHMEAFSFTNKRLFELIPDSKTKKLIEEAQMGDKRARDAIEGMSLEIIEAVLAETNVPLNDDPEAGSFVYYLGRTKTDYEERGQSILGRVVRTLVFEDKLRQAQTSIASRHMTPIRVVWMEDGDINDLEDLRAQIELALMDPDHSIVTNYQINWEEMGSNDRLPDFSSDYDRIDRQYYAGLGVTEAILTGESVYSGDRINISVMNNRYLLYREIIQHYVDEQLLKPMCARMGFIEQDRYGNDVVIYPRLSFTRLALHDTQETFDALFNLYQKGSVPVDMILDLLNIDPEMARLKLEQDFATVNDAGFNEVTRSAYGDVGRKLVEETDLCDIITANLGLSKVAPEGEEGGGGMPRFAKRKRKRWQYQ